MTWNLEKVREASAKLEAAEYVSLVVHKSPDGDAVGSATALAEMLMIKGRRVVILAPDAVPEFLLWMPHANDIAVYDAQPDVAGYHVAQADVIVCLDFNELSRIEKLGHFVNDSTAYKIMIDHHQDPGDFADATFSFTSANSTAELVFEFFRLAGWLPWLNSNMASSLYCGILTDTGSFKYPGVTANTHRIAAELHEAGIDHTEIHRVIYDTNTENRLRLSGYAVSEKLKVLTLYRTAYIWMTEEELKRFDYKKGDTEGLVNIALSLAEVDFAAFFSQKEGQVKMSFRSKGNLAVNRMAKTYFQGGGHINAAGGIFDGSMHDALALFESLLPEWIKERV